MNCEECGNELWIKPARDPNDKWCSPDCYLEWLKSMCAWQAEEIARLQSKANLDFNVTLDMERCCHPKCVIDPSGRTVCADCRAVGDELTVNRRPSKRQPSSTTSK